MYVSSLLSPLKSFLPPFQALLISIFFMPSGPLIFKRLKKKEEKNEFMFRVIRMMNSAGPGATSVKKREETEGEEDAGKRARRRRID